MCPHAGGASVHRARADSGGDVLSYAVSGINYHRRIVGVREICARQGRPRAAKGPDPETYPESVAVHKPADKSLSIADDQRRLAALAVSCFAANPVQVEAVLRAVHERQGRGEDADLLAALTAAKLITSAQADSLRRAATMPKADDEASTRKATKIDRTAPAVEVPPQVGPFRILRRLGRGGMGSVFLAFDTRENRQVALKILVADQAPKSNVLQRFQRLSCSRSLV